MTQQWKTLDVAGAPVDPYATWAIQTQWRGFERSAAGGTVAAPPVVHIIACAPDDAFFAQPRPAWLQIDPHYLQPIPGTGTRARHFTARIDRTQFDPQQLSALGLRWELSMPGRDAVAQARGAAARFGAPRDAAALLPPSPFAPGLFGTPPAPQLLAGNVIAVIDFGCPFLHPSFVAADGRTRIRALWDQGSAPVARPGDPWRAAGVFSYGRELPPAHLDAMHDALASAAVAPDEERIYRGVGHLIDFDDARWRLLATTHGAHVLGVAGADVDPLTRAADLASQAELVVVELPSLTAADSFGGSLSSCLLDAVRYVLARCAATAKIVVNISYGSQAGPHDGSSLIEAALDELLQARGNDFAIVLGAGNSRAAACHVRRPLHAQRSSLLRLHAPEADATETFVEVWTELPQGAPPLHVRVRPPYGDSSAWVDVTAQSLWLADPLRTGAAAAVVYRPPLGTASPKAMILLAIALTAPAEDDAGPLAASGVWELELGYAAGVAPTAPTLMLDAWIERDDPAPGRPARQSRFIDVDEADQGATLSSLASGALTVVVGGFNRGSEREAGYSSRGRRNTALPSVWAVCEEDAANPDVASLAVRAADASRMNGTSVAAPVLARRISNWMAGQSQAVTRTSWPSVLAQIVAASAGTLRLTVDE